MKRRASRRASNAYTIVKLACIAALEYLAKNFRILDRKRRNSRRANENSIIYRPSDILRR